MSAHPSFAFCFAQGVNVAIATLACLLTAGLARSVSAGCTSHKSIHTLIAPTGALERLHGWQTASEYPQPNTSKQWKLISASCHGGYSIGKGTQVKPMPNLRHVKPMPRYLRRRKMGVLRAIERSIFDLCLGSLSIPSVSSLSDVVGDALAKNDGWLLADPESSRNLSYRDLTWDPELNRTIGAHLDAIRLMHYKALADLAEHYGFSRDSVGVSLAPTNPADAIAGKVALDMQMPAELSHILTAKGFFDAQS